MTIFFCAITQNMPDPSKQSDPAPLHPNDPNFCSDSRLKWCDKGAPPDQYCLGNCTSGCHGLTNRRFAGKKCGKSECWGNIDHLTDVCGPQFK